MGAKFVSGKRFLQPLAATATGHPFVEAPSLLKEGIPVGTYTGYRGKPFFFDPHKMAQDETIHATNFGMIGQMGCGKSAALKLIGSRFFHLRRGELLPNGEHALFRVRFDDYRREGGRNEYAPLIERLEGKVIKLNQTACFNIFDPKMKMSEVQMTRAALNFFGLNGIVLTDFQPKLLQVGIHRMYRYAKDKASLEVLEGILDVMSLRDVHDYHTKTRSAEVQELLKEIEQKAQGGVIQDAEPDQLQNTVSNITEKQVRTGTAILAAHINSILRGPFGFIYGNADNVSLYGALSGRAVCLEWTDVPQALRTIIHVTTWDWEDAEQARGSNALTPHLVVLEEQGEALRNPRYMSLMRDRVTKSRQFNQIRFFCSQYSDDFLLGDVGSEQRQLSMAIIRSFGGWFAGRMEDTPANREMLAICGFPPVTIDKILSPSMCTGRFAFGTTGKRPRFVDFNLVPYEIPLVQTNSARDSMLA